MSENNWKDNLNNDYQESLKGFENIEDLAKSYHELRSDYAKNSIPKEDGDWDSFYNKLGRPENKQYLDDIKEDDRKVLSHYESALYDAGLSKKQGKKVLESLMALGNKTEEENPTERKMAASEMSGDKQIHFGEIIFFSAFSPRNRMLWSPYEN